MSPHLQIDAQLHLLRSKFLDACATVELAVCERLRQLGGEPSNHLSGLNIDALRKLKAAPRYSKAARAEVHLALDQLAGLQDARCDIVHGRLQPVVIDGERVACFVNVREQATNGTVARLVSQATFVEMTRRLHAIAARIRDSGTVPAVSPASSPPPPARAAAGGP